MPGEHRMGVRGENEHARRRPCTCGRKIWNRIHIRGSSGLVNKTKTVFVPTENRSDGRPRPPDRRFGRQVSWLADQHLAPCLPGSPKQSSGCLSSASSPLTVARTAVALALRFHEDRTTFPFSANAAPSVEKLMQRMARCQIVTAKHKLVEW
jgi:hypothetical protein